MIRSLCSGALALALVTASAPALAQQPAALNAPFSQEERERFYAMQARSEAVAIGYTLLLPGTGNLYAQDQFVGMLLMGTWAMGLTLLVFGLLNDERSIQLVGGGVMLADYGVGMFTSARAVSQRNRALRVRYGLERADLSAPRTLTLTLRF